MLKINAEEYRKYLKIARLTIWLIFSAKSWINRRVDSVYFPDLMSITRHVSVDISIPNQARTSKTLDGLLLLPIATVQKGDMVNFSTEDEQKKTWPLYPLDETRTIEYLMLLEWARACDLEIKDHTWIASRIEAILDVNTSYQKSRESTHEIINSLRVSSLIQGSFRNTQAFLILVKMLARDRILFAKLDGDCPQNRILKFSYDRPVHFDPIEPQQLIHLGHRFLRGDPLDREEGDQQNTKERKRRWRRLIRLELTQMVVTAANASYAQQYHFQLTAPSGVAITKAALYDEVDAMVKSPCHCDPATRCDLYGQDKHELPMGTRGRAFLRFSAIRTSWMAAACGASFSAAFVLIFIGIFTHYTGMTDAGSRIADAIPALIVAFGGVLFTVIMQPEDNNFARYLVKDFRLLALLGTGITAISITLVCSFVWKSWSTETQWAAIIGGFFVLLVALRQAAHYHNSCKIMPRPLRNNSPKDCSADHVRVDALTDGASVYFQPSHPELDRKWDHVSHEYTSVQEHEDLLDSAVRTPIESAVVRLGYTLRTEWWH